MAFLRYRFLLAEAGREPLAQQLLLWRWTTVSLPAGLDPGPDCELLVGVLSFLDELLALRAVSNHLLDGVHADLHALDRPQDLERELRRLELGLVLVDSPALCLWDVGLLQEPLEVALLPPVLLVELRLDLQHQLLRRKVAGQR